MATLARTRSSRHRAHLAVREGTPSVSDSASEGYGPTRTIFGEGRIKVMNTRRRFGGLPLVVGIAVAGMLLAGTVRCYQFYLLDGFAGCLAPLFLTEDTEYAPGYSHAAFRKVRVGMSSGEVIALLGPPLETRQLDGSRETWRWSRSRADRSYRVRAVIFHNATIVEVRHQFYVD